MPAGRGGFAGQFGLHYDSKDLDTHVEDYLTQGNFYWIKPAMLGPSDLGGWHYGVGFGVQVYDRMWERSGDEPTECGDEYHWQVRVALPDGSVHEMIPRGWNSYQSGDGFYSITPGGHAICYCATADASGCTSYGIATQPFSTGTITYYSFDGSYLRLDWQPDGNWNSLHA